MRSISPQFLEEIIGYLQRLDLLTVEEAGRAQEASSLPEQVRAVVDILAGKGSHASQTLQSFIETTNSQLYLHITVYGRQPIAGGMWGVNIPALAFAGAPLEHLEMHTEMTGAMDLPPARSSTLLWAA